MIGVGLLPFIANAIVPDPLWLVGISLGKNLGLFSIYIIYSYFMVCFVNTKALNKIFLQTIHSDYDSFMLTW